MGQITGSRRMRLLVSAVALVSLNVQPVLAQGKGQADVCAAQRAPLVTLDKQYDDLKRSKMSAAIGEGLKTGAVVLAKGVMNGGMTAFSRGGGGSFASGLGGMGGLMNAVGGMALQSAAAQPPPPGAPAPAATPGQLFGPDVLNGALGLNVPGISSSGIGGGDDMKAYAALAVLVAIVATADAYARLKEQEAGGDLKKASFNIDQDAGRQLTISRQIADSGAALVECRSQQLADINTRLAGASNDKDRKAIRRERTEFTSALKKDIDVTGSVVEQHTGMAKTFTQGRAMTDGASEADVLGGQAPAYADAAAVTRLSMPKAGAPAAAPAGGAPQIAAAAPAPAAAPAALVTIKPAPLRSAPVATATPVKSLGVGVAVQAKTAQAEGGWWEVETGGATGYLRASEVGPPGSAPAAAPTQVASAAGAKGGARGGKAPAAPAKAPPPPPAVAGPTNIRAYNGSVIAARQNGRDRLAALMTDVQTSMRKESVLYALLERVGLG